MLCDFHIHSQYSDGVLSIPQIVDLYGQAGFGAIAITDHLCESHSFFGKTARWLEKTLTEKTFSKYLEEVQVQSERAWTQYRMLVLPGFELTKNAIINSRSSHMVVLGVEEFMHADGEVVDLLKAVREKGGLSIAAHPVNTGYIEPQTYHLWSRRQELSKYFDAWEVASGRKLFQAVQESGLPMIANSDFHHPSHFTSWKTVIHSTPEKDPIFSAIRKRAVEFTYFEAPSTAQQLIKKWIFEKSISGTATTAHS